MERVIVHADMDAFFAQVEQHDDPSLRGRPVIVAFPGRRSVVTTASYEARPYGVGSAMPLMRAIRLCPQAAVVSPRFHRYTEVSRRIMEVFGTFSPSVEPLSLDEAFLDMSGAAALFGGPAEIGARIKTAVREATGLTVSVGVAPSKYVAKVASDLRKPDGLTVVAAGEVLDFLWPLPVRRLWGVGPKSETRLHALGLFTIGDVARRDRDELGATLGALGHHIAALSRGEDPRAVVTSRRAHSVGHEETLERDVRGRQAIEPILLAAADNVAGRLRRAGLLAGGVRVKLKTHRFEVHTRQAKLEVPTSNGDALFRAGRALLARFDLDPPMRLVGLAAFDPIAADRGERSLLEAPSVERDKHDRLDRTLDAMRARFGQRAVRRASHEPG